MVESPATHNKAPEAHISLLTHTPLGPLPEKHINIVTTISEKQIENPKESDNGVEESSGEKRVEIEKNPLTSSETEVVKKVYNEASYVVPPPYNQPIPFPQRFMEAKVDF